MKKFIYMNQGIFNPDYLTNGSIILKYDSDTKKFTIIDLINKDQISPTSGTVTQVQFKKEIDILNNKISGYFQYKGHVATYEDLPQPVTRNMNGDFYTVGEQQEYVCAGNDNDGYNWVPFGFNLSIQRKADKASSLSGYGITDAYTKNEANLLLNDKADKTEIPINVSQLINDSHYLTKSCSPFPAGTLTTNVKTSGFCESLISKLDSNGSDVGMIYMGTTALYDVPLDDPSDPSWESNPKSAQLLVKVVGYAYGSYILSLQLTSTGSNQRSWTTIYFQGSMKFGDSKCPWFAKLLSPIASYNESKKCGDEFKKQFRGATQKYVDDKISANLSNYINDMKIIYQSLYALSGALVKNNILTQDQLSGLQILNGIQYLNK